PLQSTTTHPLRQRFRQGRKWLVRAEWESRQQPGQSSRASSGFASTSTQQLHVLRHGHAWLDFWKLCAEAGNTSQTESHESGDQALHLPGEGARTIRNLLLLQGGDGFR